MIDFDDAPDSGHAGSGGRSSVFDSGPVGTGGLEFLDTLNDKQREAVEHTEGPLMVIAGAGSGKTKMLTSRIAYLIRAKGVAPRNILAMTFTNKAAAEMRERVEKALGVNHGAFASRFGQSARNAPEIGTFHSVCIRLLRRELHSTPYAGPFVIYDDSDQLSLVKEACKKLQIDDKTFNPKGFQAAINRLKCDAVDASDYQPTPHNLFEKKLAEVYTEYQRSLFAAQAIDFGEVLTLTYRVLRDNEKVRTKYQQWFQYLHVDEYQDTNRAQYLLLSQLASRAHGGPENLCVVGDEDQSIYKWRGADISNILDFESEYPRAHVVKLEQNYRSTQTIIEAAGKLIRNNSSRRDKTLWTDNEKGKLITHAQVPDERAEADYVVNEIKRLASSDGRAFSDFVVFYRTKAQSRSFENVFLRDKLPHQIVGDVGFYDRKEIKDVLAYFRFVLNPADSISLKRIINVPTRGIGKATVDKLESMAFAQGISLWEAFGKATSGESELSAGTVKKLVQFARIIHGLREAAPLKLVSELYHQFLDESGYVSALKSEGTEESLSRIENLESFDNALHEFEDDLGVDESTPREGMLAAFLEQITLASDVDNLKEHQPVIKLMTLHASKGLEFPVVFMVGMEEGLFPSVRDWDGASEDSEAELEEERRLCYVGMTRARQELYLLNARERRVWGDVRFSDPSRFFEEIPKELVQFQDLARRSPVASGGWGQSAHLKPSAGGKPVSFGGAVPMSPTKWRREEPEEEDVPISVPAFSASAATGAAVTALVGRRLHHPEHGSGKIKQASGSGENANVGIDFGDGRIRTFRLKYVAAYFEE